MIASLRDKNYNNIIHIAAAKSEWSEQMINIVLGPQEQDTESLNDQGEKSFRRLSSKLFLMSKWIPNIFPYYLVPEIMMHLNMSLDSKNSAGDTPLIIAAKQNRIEVVRVLLEKEVKINIRNYEGYTALNQATMKKNKHIVELLLEKEAQKNIALPSGQTPLHTAVQNQDIEIVKLLMQDLEKGAWLLKKKRNGEHGYETPLQLAVRLGFHDIVHYLIGDGAQSWETREDWKPMVYTAVAGGHKMILKLLIRKGRKDLWDGISRHCLITAVEDKNKTAVNALFNPLYNEGEDFPDNLPAHLSRNQSILNLLQGLENLKDNEKEKQRETALQEAKEALEQQAIQGEKEKVKSIIKKLENEGEDRQEEPGVNVSNTEKEIKMKKVEYMKYIKALKAKNNKDVIKDLDKDLEWFTNFHMEITKIIQLEAEH